MRTVGSSGDLGDTLGFLHFRGISSHILFWLWNKSEGNMKEKQWDTDGKKPPENYGSYNSPLLFCL